MFEVRFAGINDLWKIDDPRCALRSFTVSEAGHFFGILRNKDLCKCSFIQCPEIVHGCGENVFKRRYDRFIGIFRCLVYSKGARPPEFPLSFFVLEVKQRKLSV